MDTQLTWKGLPRLDINFTGTVTKETALNATCTFTNAYGSTYTSAELPSGFCTIKGRGNSTWTLAKKPYAFVTKTSSYANLATTPFGLPSEKDWVLLAAYQDKTFMRTMFVHRMAYILGQSWASRSVHVELYLNGSYEGIYIFCEKVEGGANRIAGPNPSTANQTGTYMVEQQTFGQIEASDKYFESSEAPGTFFTYKVPDPPTDAQVAVSKARMDDFIHRYSFVPVTDLTNGYRAVIDALSYAQYYILQELIQNSDAGRNSTYTTMVQSGPLVAGPFWDADGSLGLFDYDRDGYNVLNPYQQYYRHISPHYGVMMNDPYFFELVKDLFNEKIVAIHALFQEMLDYIPQLVATGAVQRTRERWPDILADATYIPLPSYDAEIERFADFIRARFTFFYNNVFNYVAPQPAIIPTNPQP